ncbi:MAG: SpaH/EbpB family LPXTG-anchored major pilin [Clostridium sp.]|nr:SpaH/EbpB family LPXTG-anchored major pilin [Clostridium sp.]MCI7442431.1 SpaH/EbpB family LPXTG-anchored major pilin [Clostridium sp.]
MKVKNKIKQILSIIVTAMMMMSLFTVNAFAMSTGVGTEEPIKKDATTGKITITNPTSAPNAVYTAYKVLTAHYVEGQSTYSYTVDNAFKSIIDTEADPSSTVKYTVKRTGEIVNKGTDTVADSYLLAREIEKVINTAGFAGDSQVLTSGTADLPIGYYAVLQTGSSDEDAWVATAPILAAVPAFGSSVDKFFYQQTIDPKGNEITVDKNIVQETVGTTDLQSNSYSVKKDDASVGDILTYELKADVPHYTVEGSETGVPASYDESKIVFELIDTLSSGLTYKGSIEAHGYLNDADTTGTDITNKLVNPPVASTEENYIPTGDTELKFSFNGKYSDIKAYKYIKITYKAQVNKNAVIGASGNPNEVKLHYTVNPSKNTDTNTDKITTVTYSYNVAIKKIDASGNEITTDSVEFELYRKVGTEYVLVKSLGKDSTATIDSTTGKITFTGSATLTGLDAGEYKLKEVKAPSGYTLPANPDTYFTIVAGNTDGNLDGSHTVTGTTVDTTDNLTVKVTNTQGVTLPQTGGAGTWMFTIGGLVLMAGAVVVFMATRKKKAN